MTAVLVYWKAERQTSDAGRSVLSRSPTTGGLDAAHPAPPWAPSVRRPDRASSPRGDGGAHAPSITAPAPFERPEQPRDYWSKLEQLRATDLERALDYALEGEHWYADPGRFTEARHAMIVDLLVDLGRMSEARERARVFLKEHPKSEYRPLVQGVTGIHPRPGPPPGY